MATLTGVTNTFVNGQTADATEVNTNFTDLVNATKDGTIDFSIAAITCAGNATFNANTTIGNATSDDLTVTARVASDLIPKTDSTYDLGNTSLRYAEAWIDAITGTSLTMSGACSFDAAVTINDSGAAVDFRVEGDTDANLFFCDGSADKVGVGTNSPSSKLHVKSASGELMRVESTAVAGTAAGYIGLWDAGGAIRGLVGYNAANDVMSLKNNRFGNIELTTGSGTIMTLEDGGNVGVNNSNPVVRLESVVTGGRPATSGTAQANAAIRAKSSGANAVLDIGCNNASPYDSWLQATDSGNLSLTYPLILNPNGGGVGIGVAPDRTFNVLGASASNVATIKTPSDNVGNLAAFDFEDGGGQVGQILMNTTADTTAYNTSSDERLKVDKGSWEALPMVKATVARKYERKSQPGVLEYGCFAQELHKVLPQAVSVGGEDPKANPWMIDYSQIAGLLLKAVQELTAKVEALEAKSA